MHKILLLVTSLILVSCQSVDKKTQDLYLKKSEAYEAKITRDIWGVPHVYGKTDADAAFGLAFAHAEDDFKNIAENMYLSWVAMSCAKMSLGLSLCSSF